MNLIEQVRDTRTLQGDNHVYQNAEIEINQVIPDEINPIALYVMLPGLRWLYSQIERLLAHGVNPFNLTDIYRDEEITMGPPLIERSDGGWSIVDGLHRFFLARRENIKITAIQVDGADPSIPLVGLPVDWRDVKQVMIKPEKACELKLLRPGIEDTSDMLRSHYRDLRYLGSRGRRPREGQNE